MKKNRTTKKTSAAKPAIQIAKGAKTVFVTMLRDVTVTGIGGGVIRAGSRMLIPHGSALAFRGDGDRITAVLSGRLVGGRLVGGNSTCNLPAGSFALDSKEADAMARNHRKQCPSCICEFCAAAKSRSRPQTFRSKELGLVTVPE